MRDPNRIPEIISLLEKAWKKYPDLRLGQLVSNLGYNPDVPEADIFYVEDDRILAALKRFIKENDIE